MIKIKSYLEVHTLFRGYMCNYDSSGYFYSYREEFEELLCFTAKDNPLVSIAAWKLG